MAKPRNPFPGMNPFFEVNWGDVHTRLIVGIADQLGEELPRGLVIRAQEKVGIAGGNQKYEPDVRVAEKWKDGLPPVWTPEDSSAPVYTLTEPIIFYVEPATERWLEIRDREGKLVTALEVLSPSNKSGKTMLEYLEKQEDLLASGVNLVEIDLLRGGSHVAAVDAEALDCLSKPEYLVCVARQQRGCTTRREIYPCSLRDALPTFRVPLRAQDPDIPLALQPLIDRIYQAGRYWEADSHLPLKPPLPPEDAAWVEERLQAAGLK